MVGKAERTAATGKLSCMWVGQQPPAANKSGQNVLLLQERAELSQYDAVSGSQWESSADVYRCRRQEAVPESCIWQFFGHFVFKIPPPMPQQTHESTSSNIYSIISRRLARISFIFPSSNAAVEFHALPPESSRARAQRRSGTVARSSSRRCTIERPSP